MIQHSGLEGLSLRNLAAACNTSTTAVYSLFGNKDNLVDSVAHLVFDQLEGILTNTDTGDGTLPALLGMMTNYRVWALDHRHFYTALFGLNPLRKDTMTLLVQAVSPFRRTVEAGVQRGEFAPGAGDADDILLSVWIFLRGYIAMELRFQDVQSPPRSMDGKFGPENFRKRAESLLASLRA